MNKFENRRSYKEAIGEFIVAFAEIEVWVTMYDAIIKTENATTVPLVGSFSVPITKKLKRINKFISDNFSKDILERWQQIVIEINDLNLHRNHIIHGTGFSSFWGEYIKTAIDEERNFQKLSYKNLSIKDIKSLSEKTYHVLTGNDGIQGFFMQDFLKAVRNHFSSHK